MFKAFKVLSKFDPGDFRCILSSAKPNTVNNFYQRHRLSNMHLSTIGVWYHRLSCAKMEKCVTRKAKARRTSRIYFMWGL